MKKQLFILACMAIFSSSNVYAPESGYNSDSSEASSVGHPDHTPGSPHGTPPSHSLLTSPHLIQTNNPTPSAAPSRKADIAAIIALIVGIGGMITTIISMVQNRR